MQIYTAAVTHLVFISRSHSKELYILKKMLVYMSSSFRAAESTIIPSSFMAMSLMASFVTICLSMSSNKCLFEEPVASKFEVGQL